MRVCNRFLSRYAVEHQRVVEVCTLRMVRVKVGVRVRENPTLIPALRQRRPPLISSFYPDP